MPARTLVSTTAYPPAQDRLGLRHRIDPATWNWLRVEVEELPDRMRFDLDDSGRLLVPWQGKLLVGSRRDSGGRVGGVPFPGLEDRRALAGQGGRLPGGGSRWSG